MGGDASQFGPVGDWGGEPHSGILSSGEEETKG